MHIPYYITTLLLNHSLKCGRKICEVMLGEVKLGEVRLSEVR